VNETQERTNVKMGTGNDYIEYVINAPVDIDGGSGFDKLALIATEFNDKFVVTKKGVFGYASHPSELHLEQLPISCADGTLTWRLLLRSLGLTITFSNLESVTVYGLEGDDEIYVQSTDYRYVVRSFVRAWHAARPAHGTLSIRDPY
jgi:hypothetical protein